MPVPVEFVIRNDHNGLCNTYAFSSVFKKSEPPRGGPSDKKRDDNARNEERDGDGHSDSQGDGVLISFLNTKTPERQDRAAAGCEVSAARGSSGSGTSKSQKKKEAHLSSRL